MVRIVTDGAVDLPAEWYKEYDIQRIPINVHFGEEKTFIQDVELDQDGFYKLVNSKTLPHPKTSQPSPHQFVGFYKKTAQPGDTNSASGAVLDRDANAACNQSPPTVENVYWGTQPMPGQYRIRVVAYDMCGGGNTPVTLTIAVGGRVVGAYTLNFTYDRQEFTIPFNLP